MWTHHCTFVLYLYVLGREVVGKGAEVRGRQCECARAVSRYLRRAAFAGDRFSLVTRDNKFDSRSTFRALALASKPMSATVDALSGRR